GKVSGDRSAVVDEGGDCAGPSTDTLGIEFEQASIGCANEAVVPEIPVVIDDAGDLAAVVYRRRIGGGRLLEREGRELAVGGADVAFVFGPVFGEVIADGRAVRADTVQAGVWCTGNIERDDFGRLSR